MPHARPSARRLLTVAVILSALALCVSFKSSVTSQACPINLPKPLRVLYTTSEFVVVARVGETIVAGRDAEQGSSLMKTALRISTQLKGEHKEKAVSFYYRVWGGEEEEAARPYEKGETLLLFLTPREEGEGYEVGDAGYGVKKLPDADLKVYVRRIEELADILRQEKPDPAAITEWLVRCAEEPATRWEGTYDLAANASFPPDPDEDIDGSGTANRNAPEQAQVIDEVAPDVKEADAAAPSFDIRPAASNDNAGASNQVAGLIQSGTNQTSTAEEIDFAALLTPAQKERVANVLFDAKELNDDVYPLLRLVGSWNDQRLVPYVLQHLARMADKPRYQAEDLMSLVAHLLRDRSLIKFAEDYSRDATYADGDDEEETQSRDDEAERGATAEERAASKKEAEEQRAAAIEARFQRSGKLRHFLALADQPQQP